MDSMNYVDTSLQRASRIALMAKDSFANHRLSRGSVEGMYTCRNPDSIFYSFAAWFGPGVVLIWGDVGEFVLRGGDGPSSDDSLKWFLSIDSVDYLGKKLKALEGVKRRFCLGDALAVLDDMEREAGNELGPDSVVTEDGVEREVSDALRLRDDVAHVRTEMRDVENDSAEVQEARWHQAWNERDDWDPPQCRGWTTDVMWLHECQKTMRRLSGSIL